MIKFSFLLKEKRKSIFKNLEKIIGVWTSKNLSAWARSICAADRQIEIVSEYLNDDGQDGTRSRRMEIYIKSLVRQK